jgi:hypothetical protein
LAITLNINKAIFLFPWFFIYLYLSGYFTAKPCRLPARITNVYWPPLSL